MRIVKSLNEVSECPNCGRKDYFLHNHTNDMGREYLFWTYCHEELFEDEDTCYDVGKTPDDIDDTLMDIEYELGQLTLWAHDKHSLDQLAAIKSILEQFLSVIRRMK